MQPVMSRSNRIRVAIVNDYELIVEGLRELLQPFGDTIEIVEMRVGEPARYPVDVALYDSFAMGSMGWAILDQLIHDPQVASTIVYSNRVPKPYEKEVLQRGARAVLSKATSADGIVDALQAATAGTPVVLAHRINVESGPGTWPGKAFGLSEREAETLALICQGLSNVEIAERLILTLNTVKTYIRSSYRKIGATTRAEAVLWGSQNGFASAAIPLPRLHNASRPSLPVAH